MTLEQAVERLKGEHESGMQYDARYRKAKPDAKRERIVARAMKGAVFMIGERYTHEQYEADMAMYEQAAQLVKV